MEDRFIPFRDEKHMQFSTYQLFNEPPNETNLNLRKKTTNEIYRETLGKTLFGHTPSSQFSNIIQYGPIKESISKSYAKEKLKYAREINPNPSFTYSMGDFEQYVNAFNRIDWLYKNDMNWMAASSPNLLVKTEYRNDKFLNATSAQIHNISCLSFNNVDKLLFGHENNVTIMNYDLSLVNLNNVKKKSTVITLRNIPSVIDGHDPSNTYYMFGDISGEFSMVDRRNPFQILFNIHMDNIPITSISKNKDNLVAIMNENATVKVFDMRNFDGENFLFQKYDQLNEQTRGKCLSFVPWKQNTLLYEQLERNQNFIILHNLITNEINRYPVYNGIVGIDWSHIDKEFALAYYDRENNHNIDLWSFTLMEIIESLNTEDNILSIKYDSVGEILSSYNENNTISIWNISKEKKKLPRERSKLLNQYSMIR